MSLIVKPFEEMQFSFEEYYNFIQEAYVERVEQGIPFVCTTLSVEGLREDIKKNKVHIYVGYLNENPGEIAASIGVAYRHNRDGNYAWFHLVATNNKLKGRGIGTQMLKEMIDIAKKNGCDYVSLSTAKKAISAVNFYLKSGFFISGEHVPLWGGYESYTFHYQLVYPSKWDKILYRKYRLTLSRMKQALKRIIVPVYKIKKNGYERKWTHGERNIV